jgi:predicted transcriptional regulator
MATKVKVTPEEIKTRGKELVSKVDQFIKKCTDDVAEKEAWNAVLSFVEILALNSKTKVDDFVLLPLMKTFRKKYEI